MEIMLHHVTEIMEIIFQYVQSNDLTSHKIMAVVMEIKFLT